VGSRAITSESEKMLASPLLCKIVFAFGWRHVGRWTCCTGTAWQQQL